MMIRYVATEIQRPTNLNYIVTYNANNITMERRVIMRVITETDYESDYKQQMLIVHKITTYYRQST